MSEADSAVTVAVVGVGKMGGALIQAFIGRDMLSPEQIVAADKSPPARDAIAAEFPSLSVHAEASTAVAEGDVLIVCVKPQDFAKAFSGAVEVQPEDQLVVSIMAGTTIDEITTVFGEKTAVIRAMPNVCCEVAEGAFGYAPNEHVTDEQIAMVDRWFNGIGAAEKLSEKLLDAVTGLSGSGPAFVATFIEALADGGVAAGLPRNVAQRLAAQTVLGTAKCVLENDQGPAELKDAVCSPAGTTISGMRRLEKDALRSAAMEAVVAAAKRSQELGD